VPWKHYPIVDFFVFNNNHLYICQVTFSNVSSKIPNGGIYLAMVNTTKYYHLLSSTKAWKLDKILWLYYLFDNYIHCCYYIVNQNYLKYYSYYSSEFNETLSNLMRMIIYEYKLKKEGKRKQNQSLEIINKEKDEKELIDTSVKKKGQQDVDTLILNFIGKFKNEFKEKDEKELIDTPVKNKGQKDVHKKT